MFHIINQADGKMNSRKNLKDVQELRKTQKKNVGSYNLSVLFPRIVTTLHLIRYSVELFLHFQDTLGQIYTVA